MRKSTLSTIFEATAVSIEKHSASKINYKVAHCSFIQISNGTKQTFNNYIIRGEIKLYGNIYVACLCLCLCSTCLAKVFDSTLYYVLNSENILFTLLDDGCNKE